jgi:hypothetical protein
MKNIPFPRLLLLATISLCVISCQNGCGKKENAIIPGKLSIFSIPTEEFLKLKPFDKDSVDLGSLYLNFRIDKEKFDMTGWQYGQQGTSRSGFGTAPDIHIEHAKSSKIEYSKGMYLSSIIYSNKQVKGIMDAIKDSPGQYLVFSPTVSESNPDIIIYELDLSTSKTALRADFVADSSHSTFISVKLPFPGCPMPPGCRL